MLRIRLARGVVPAALNRKLLGLQFLLLGVTMTGCGQPVVQNASLGVAESALKDSLDAWKAGSSVDEQRRQSSPVYVSDELWQKGSRLIDYRLVTGGESYGSNVRFQVELACKNQNGRTQKLNVYYLISTEPAITIARQE